MKEHGELEWARLSERQRQHMLAQQKLKERRLRREGRYDEIEAMLAGVKDTEEGKKSGSFAKFPVSLQIAQKIIVHCFVLVELKRKLGETKADQERHLQGRLKRRQELIKEREDKGLSCEEAILDAIQDQEEEEQNKEERKKRKVMLNLGKCYL